MDKQAWDKAIRSKFELIRKMINMYEVELNKMDGETAMAYLQPIDNILFEAVSEVLDHRHKREEAADNMLNSILNNED